MFCHHGRSIGAWIADNRDLVAIAVVVVLVVVFCATMATGQGTWYEFTPPVPCDPNVQCPPASLALDVRADSQTSTLTATLVCFARQVAGGWSGDWFGDVVGVWLDPDISITPWTVSCPGPFMYSGVYQLDEQLYGPGVTPFWIGLLGFTGAGQVVQTSPHLSGLGLVVDVVDVFCKIDVGQLAYDPSYAGMAPLLQFHAILNVGGHEWDGSGPAYLQQTTLVHL